MKQRIVNFLHLLKDFLQRRFEKMDLSSLSKKTIPFFFKYKRWILTFLITLALADLVILFIWPALLPKSDITLSKPKTLPVKKNRTAGSNFIHTVNIFHSAPIPPPLTELEDKQEITASGESKKTGLPFKLLGTIENFDPKKSMASIQAAGETNAYFVGDTIDNKARVTQVQRRKAVFINLINNQLEHLEIPKEESTVDFTKQSEIKPEDAVNKGFKEKKSSHKGISQVEKNQYSVTRSSLNDYIQQLPDILQQARLEPQYGTDGKIRGHTFTWIEEGSVFESLGFTQGDMLISVNGEKINDNTEAQKLFQQFRTASQFSVIVKNKKGEDREISYDINEDASVQ